MLKLTNSLIHHAQADHKYITKARHCWPFVWGIHQWLMDSHHKVPIMQKVFLCHDVIMVRVISEKCIWLQYGQVFFSVIPYHDENNWYHTLSTNSVLWNWAGRTTMPFIINRVGSVWSLTILVLNLEYSRKTGSIWWLLMPRLLMSPGHQQPWHWHGMLHILVLVFYQEGFQPLGKFNG